MEALDYKFNLCGIESGVNTRGSSTQLDSKSKKASVLYAESSGKTKEEAEINAKKEMLSKVQEKTGYSDDIDVIKCKQNDDGTYSAIVCTKLDEFYDTHLNGKIDTNQSNTKIFTDISSVVKEEIKKSSLDGNSKYDDSIGICVPMYKDGAIGEKIDCSSYVSMCLYEYSICMDDVELNKYVKTYRTEAGGTDIGDCGQITAGQYYSTPTERLDKMNMESIVYDSDSIPLKKGDILVTRKHVEIFSGNDGKVYSCGSDNSMKEIESNISNKAGSGTKIIRIRDNSED